MNVIAKIDRDHQAVTDERNKIVRSSYKQQFWQRDTQRKRRWNDTFERKREHILTFRLAFGQKFASDVSRTMSE